MIDCTAERRAIRRAVLVLGMFVAGCGYDSGYTTITPPPPPPPPPPPAADPLPEIFINEVFPVGTATNGWVELYNPTARAVDVSGWYVTNNADGTRHGVLPTPTIILAGDFLVVDESVFPLGLNSRDFIRLFNKSGVQSDAFAWGHEPIHSYGRCPDAQSGLGETTLETKGGPNFCAF